MAQITSITSESLQSQIRTLLPSQQGFGEDLQASNVIVPTIDLTAAAQGTTTPQILMTALAFGSQTAFSVANTSTVLANTAGFYRIFGVANDIKVSSSGQDNLSFSMSDGLSTKTIWQSRSNAAATADVNYQYDFVVFLASGDSLTAISNDAEAFLDGSIRQIADVNGNLTAPSGFSPQ